MVVRSQMGNCQEKQKHLNKRMTISRACSRGEEVTSNGTQMFGVGTLLNQFFPCRICRIRSTFELAKEPEGFTILADLGVPPFRKRPYVTKTFDVSSESHDLDAAGFSRPKDGREAHLISDLHLRPARQENLGRRRSPPSWSRKRVQHPRILGPSSKIQPRPRILCFRCKNLSILNRKVMYSWGQNPYSEV